MKLDRFDLHLHTSASDGLMSPEDMVAAAAAAGLACIAVTDHDTTAGILPARAAGLRLGFPVVGGAEFTAESAGELHILGYGMDIASPAWRAFTAEQQRRRAERNELMLRRLETLGLALPEECLPGNTAGEYGRMHMARGLVKAGLAGSVQQAFGRYLEKGRPAYVKRRKFTAAELVGAIRKAGGDAVLAHPGRMGAAPRQLEALVAELRELGLRGIEAFYPSHTTEESEFYSNLALRRGLVCTYGSDWHGQGPAGLAFGFDCFDIPQETYAWLAGLMQRQEGLDEGYKD